MKWILAVTLALPCVSSAVGQEQPVDPGDTWKEEHSVDARWNEMEVGPFVASVLPVPGLPVAKGLSVRVGDQGGTAVGYDLANGTMRAAWTGGFLKFDPRRYGIVKAPAPGGPIVWSTTGAAWPGAEVDYEGMFVHGPHVALWYRVNGREVLESPWAFDGVVTRSFVVSPNDSEIELRLHASAPKESENPAIEVVGAEGATVGLGDGHVTVTVPAARGVARFTVVYGSASAITKHSAAAAKLDPTAWTEPGPRLWDRTLETKGSVGKNDDDAPYVVDTINLPFENPWKALLFLAGLDFLSDGTAVVSSMHGDVWLVRGIDESLETVTWQRFATGLHQPLGLKVRDDEIFVLGRDQITRLHDRNGDGEADWYECFNNDGATSTSGHDFAACLEADAEGNLYYIRAHEGVCRVSADGSKHESLAKGFRNPIGLGVGPDGTITAAPQEGTWTPKSAVFEVRPGGWYGFGGPQVTDSRPLGYDPPICWIPRLSDNSSGGQVWVTCDRFGPLEGRMLHLSYGQCAALLVMREHENDVPQGASLRLPWFFESGAMTGRFNPKDGQLYVVGLRGWQTAAAKDGCLQRVRYTGKPVHWPVEWHVRPRGIELVFTSPLDPESATDPQNWAVEQWNYLYRKEYGSEDFRVSNPRRTGRDEVFVDDVTLSADGRTVYIELEDDVEPVMQMGITYLVKAADGTPLRNTVYGTINAVPEK